VCCLKDSVTGLVVDVASGSNTNATDLRSKRIAQVVTVQVHRCNDAELLGTRQHLLQRNVGDRVLDQQLLLPGAVSMRRPNGRHYRRNFVSDACLLAVGHHVVSGLDGTRILLDAQLAVAIEVAQDPALALGNDLVTELRSGDIVAPVTEGTLGELHNVALVHQRDAGSLLLQCILEIRVRRRHNVQSAVTFVQYQWSARAYDALHTSIAERTRRSVPSRETGLMPKPELSGNRIFFAMPCCCFVSIIKPNAQSANRSVGRSIVQSFNRSIVQSFNRREV
jgi:hypothetical protein